LVFHNSQRRGGISCQEEAAKIFNLFAALRE
jgi:hypothetical protein